jgi:zinc protease
VLGNIQENMRQGRTDDYYNRRGVRYQAMTLDQIRAEFNATLKPDSSIWAVVGDAAVIKPQLEPLGRPLNVIEADSVFSRTGCGRRQAAGLRR